MFNEITTYLDAIFTELGNNSSYDFLKVNLLEQIPENKKQSSYRLLLESDEDAQISASAFDVQAIVELSFLIPNGDETKYKSVIDDYIHRVVKHIWNNSSYKHNSSWAMNVLKVGASDLNNIEDGELKCNVTLEIRVVDNVAIDTGVPSAPTLTSPADNYTDGSTDQSFNWTGTADSYDFILTRNGSTVLMQTGLTNSSFTIPADALLTDTYTYSWSVRGKNAGGYGDWATYRTFTVNDSPALPEVPSLTSPIGTTDNDLNVTFVWELSANSTSYDFQIASDSGFTTLLRDSNVTATVFDFTFSTDGTYYWRVRGVNDAGSSDWADSTVVILQFAYEPETTAFASRHSVAPDSTRKGHMNTLIKTLKDNSIWDRLDVLQVYESHSVTSSDWGLNWRKNTHNATSSATSVGLTVNAPVTTNGSSSYIKTGFSPLTEGVAFSKERCALGVLLTSTTSSSGFDIGFAGTLGTAYIRIQIRNSGSYFARLNTVSGSVLTGSQTSASAFHTFVRNGLTSVTYYRGTSSVNAGTGQDIGTIPGGEIEVGRGEGGNYRAGSYGAFFAGTYLDSTQVSTLITALTTYITAIGGTV